MAESLIQDVLTETVDWGSPTPEQMQDEVVHDVLLCGPKSKNGRLYTEKSFGGSANVSALYEGRLVFFNHVKGSQNPLDRPVQDMAGVIQNVRFTESGVRGDINTSGTPYGPLLRSLSRTKAKGVGMSHTAKGLVDPKTGETKVTEVYSVDVVINPATTNTFTESTKMELSESLVKENADIRVERDAFKAEVVTLQAQLKEAKETIEKMVSESNKVAGDLKQLTEKVAAFEKVEAEKALKEAVVNELHAAGLKEPVAESKDPVHIPESIMTILLSLDGDARKALIAERASFVKAAPSPGALPRANGGSTNKFDADAYLKQFSN